MVVIFSFAAKLIDFDGFLEARSSCVQTSICLFVIQPVIELAQVSATIRFEDFCWSADARKLSWLNLSGEEEGPQPAMVTFMALHGPLPLASIRQSFMRSH